MKKKWNGKTVREYLIQEGYFPLSEYRDSKTKIEALCPEGHKCFVGWYPFVKGARCKTCAVQAVGATKRTSIKEVKSLAEERGYKFIALEYKEKYTFVNCICSQNHQCLIEWQSFKKAKGNCNRCCKNRKKNHQEVFDLFKKEGYSLITKYERAKQYLWVLCSNQHAWLCTWSDFQAGNRCPECVGSNGEKRLKEILKQIFPDLEIKRGSNLGFLKYQKADYYIPNLNLVVEYDGEQHFKPVRFHGISMERALKIYKHTKKLDRKKNKICKQHGIKLIRIPYTEELTIDNIRKKLKEIGPC